MPRNRVKYPRNPLQIDRRGLTRCARLSLGGLGNAQQESRTLYDYFCYK